MKTIDNKKNMLDNYDFSKGIKGKYAKRYAEGTNIVMIDPDIAKFFPSNDSVNEALRSILTIVQKHSKKKGPIQHGAA